MNFLLEGEIEKKNNFNKKTKTNKKIRTELKNIIYNNFGLNGEIKNQ